MSLFAVVFNSFRRSRQPFIHMQLLSVELHTIMDNKKYNSIGTCRWGVLCFSNINASIDSNTYLNFWFHLSPWKWRHAFFIIHSMFQFIGVQICFIFLSFWSELLNMSREIWNSNKTNVYIDSSWKKWNIFLIFCDQWNVLERKFALKFNQNSDSLINSFLIEIKLCKAFACIQNIWIWCFWWWIFWMHPLKVAANEKKHHREFLCENVVLIYNVDFEKWTENWNE